MKQIQTEIIIGSSAEKIWLTLMDFDHYQDWNPFIRSISGNQSVNAALTVFLQPPGMSGMTIKPKVLKLETNKEFRWKGKLLFGGIFDGEHYFMLKPQSDGTTKFIHGEIFNGILIPILGGVLKKTQDGFEAMNKALKETCEKEDG